MRMNEAKVLIAIVIILLLGIFQLASNTKKNRRIRQFPLIIISLVIMGIFMYMWMRCLVKIKGVYVFSEYIMDSNLEKIVMGKFWDDIFDRMNWGWNSSLFKNGDLAAVNIAIFLNYVLIRIVIRPVITKICASQKLLKTFEFGIYQYDEEYDEWFIKKQWIKFRKYFFALAVATAVFSGFYLGITWVYGQESALWTLAFPVAAVVVVNEIYSFISGQTKEEYEYKILGDESDARRIDNYYKLREVFENILPEPLLSAYTGNDFCETQSCVELLKQMHDNDDDIDTITAEYFETEDRYKTANVDYVQAASKMMHGRNVVFFDPFYRDLDIYITLPMVKALLSGRRCIVLCGRKSAAQDIKKWITEILQKYSHMQYLWRIDFLSDEEPECEVGIVTFTQIYDKRIINTNREFLAETDFVLMVEPSVMLSTSQVALSIIAEEMHKDNEGPVYCICDRNSVGLIDTLSHLLQTEITDAVASPVPRCSYTAMCWNADGDFRRQQLFDKQTKYLGNGIELAAIAIKNQIPQVSWYSETKVPVKDIKWIAGLYYTTICRYMNQPSQQKILYDKIDFMSDMWSVKPSKEKFIIAEDEFCNMFSMMRAFLSRGKSQAFVNIMSENYLLRDYMRCNRQVFMSDSNAIPSFVPDYAKTERNTILKLIMMMVMRTVQESEVLRELHLVGIETADSIGALSELVGKYTFADSNIFTVQSVRTSTDGYTTGSSCTYSITDEVFSKYFAGSLKNAYYILEDEKNEEGYIDAKLFSHVTQTVLPGQFVTYDGKYYVVKYVSPQSGVVLHRASDLFDSRRYYRQIRDYFIDGGHSEIVSNRKIGDIEFAEIRTDFHVDTSGYLDMNDLHDLRTARIIDLSDDPSKPYYSRKYRNKSLLRIKLPDSNDQICFNVCLLLSEVFRSVFPDAWPYLAVVTKRPDDIKGMLNYMVYSVEGDIGDGCIYVIEDSDIDLGLLNAVEKNFTKLMEIVTDYLEWHYEKMREPAEKDPVPIKAGDVEAEDNKKRGLVVKMLDRIRKLFGTDSKNDKIDVGDVDKVESLAEETEKTADKASEIASKEDGESASEDVAYELNNKDEEKKDADQNVALVSEGNEGEYSLDDNDNNKTVQEAEEIKDSQAVSTEEQKDEEKHPEDDFEPDGAENPDIAAIDGTDIFDNDGVPEDNEYLEDSFVSMGLKPIAQSRYQRECFLKFGFDEIDSRIKTDDVRKYLRVRGWSDNSLTKARKREIFDKTITDTNATIHCDFCGLPLNGVSYERLSDGRLRCNDCTDSAITNLTDFEDLFKRTVSMMENFYGITYHMPITVKMTDAKTVAKGFGSVYKPADESGRILGFAQHLHGKYSVVVENGNPRLASIDNMVHEMTHIWQYLNWNETKFDSVYGMNDSKQSKAAKDIVFEGMSVWSSIQYLYQIGESYYASQQEELSNMRTDVYGIGFKLFCEQYPLVKDSSILKYSPFQSFPVIEPDKVKNAAESMCHKEQS